MSYIGSYPPPPPPRPYQSFVQKVVVIVKVIVSTMCVELQITKHLTFVNTIKCIAIKNF